MPVFNITGAPGKCMMVNKPPVPKVTVSSTQRGKKNSVLFRNDFNMLVHTLLVILNVS
ncbi:MAG: hypothetical protein ACI9GM_001500 [Salibacteraceae bacterium]